jgi:hypothetical protein
MHFVNDCRVISISLPFTVFLFKKKEEKNTPTGGTGSDMTRKLSLAAESAQ